jgi:hypothetical protein
MASGAEFPDSINLTKSEAELAHSDSDFFLAVVCGLEANKGSLKVRFIFNPLQNLTLQYSGDIILSGVRDVQALEYIFGDFEVNSESS